MGDADKAAILGRVLSDAHVIDVDFSTWDRAVSLYAFAEQFGPVREGRLPLVAIRFLRTTQVGFWFNHYSIRLASPRHHFQWRIDKYRIERRSRSYRIEVFSHKEQFPRVEVTCAAFAVEPISARVFDLVYPGWDRAYTALARPSIERLAGIARRKAGNRESGRR